MIGADFDGHPWTQDTEVAISAFDRTNPVTRVWPESFRLQEETYQFRDFDATKSKATIGWTPNTRI
jgi:type 1 glutamine amidotransferase